MNGEKKTMIVQRLIEAAQSNGLILRVTDNILQIKHGGRGPSDLLEMITLHQREIVEELKVRAERSRQNP